jgi:two-component system chemotaxis sensor kinase CheA
MGLVVDEIVDIVEERLDIQVGSEIPGVLGSAVIKSKATEIIDIGHFLPLAFEDWFTRKEIASAALTRSLLFIDDSPFFRNMLGPVLKAAGFNVTSCESATDAMKRLGDGEHFDVIVSDIEMPVVNGFELAEMLRRDPRFKATPIIALSAVCTPASIERGRLSGFDDYVAKFDRPGLIATLKEVTSNELGIAA